MNDLLLIREKIILFYKKYDVVILALLKFLVGFTLFRMIDGLGVPHEKIANLMGEGSFIMHLFMAVIFTILPPTPANGLVVLYLALQVSSSISFAVLVLLLGLAILLFYGRMAPQKSYLIVGILLGFHFKMPYAVVLFAGLYMGVSSVIPLSIGTFVWYVWPKLQSLLQTMEPADVGEHAEKFLAVPLEILATFKVFFATLIGDYRWVFIAFVFAMMVIAVAFISKISFKYAREISIIAGGFVGLVGMIFAITMVDIPLSIGGVFIASIFSVMLMLLLSLFDMVLDYDNAERLQFQDEYFYYHVQVIPKIGLERPSFKDKSDKKLMDSFRKDTNLTREKAEEREIERARRREAHTRDELENTRENNKLK